MKTIRVNSVIEIPKDYTGIVEYSYGTKYWYKEGKLHREDGPAIEQISYLLFMKRLDEYDLKNIQDAKFTGEKYLSIFAGSKKELRWSHFKQMEPSAMLEHVQKNVFPFLKTLGAEDSPFAKHMGNAVFIISKASLLVEAVLIIDEIFDEIQLQQSEGQGFQDTQGDLYEYLLSEITSAGKFLYRTNNFFCCFT
jgi:type I restriction enzyme M protein